MINRGKVRRLLISYIKGILAQISEEFIVLECYGMGYQITVPSSWIEQLPPIGTKLTVHTYLQVREDGISLYGFKNPRQKQVYEWLIRVNGVGPKAAMGILSTLEPDDLSLAVLTEDAKMISKAPGIGLKTAKKIILELKDKMKDYDFIEESNTSNLVENDLSIRKETIEAMEALGYSHSEAVTAVKNIEFTKELSVEMAIKLALKAAL